METFLKSESKFLPMNSFAHSTENRDVYQPVCWQRPHYRLIYTVTQILLPHIANVCNELPDSLCIHLHTACTARHSWHQQSVSESSDFPKSHPSDAINHQSNWDALVSHPGNACCVARFLCEKKWLRYNNGNIWQIWIGLNNPWKYAVGPFESRRIEQMRNFHVITINAFLIWCENIWLSVRSCFKILEVHQRVHPLVAFLELWQTLSLQADFNWLSFCSSRVNNWN